jgi:TRAP-type mannitol/chloroaromatic compound transport system substrate-binding protein
MNRRGAIKAGLALAATGAVVGMPKIGNAAVNMRMQTHWSSGLPFYYWYEEVAKKAGELTGGELAIKALPANTVVPSADMLEACGRGLLDMVFGYPAYWLGKMPAANFLGGLYGLESHEEQIAFWYESDALKILREAYAEHGVHLVGPIAAGPMGIYSKKPLETLDDIKGYKFRTTGMTANIMKELGGTPLFFPMTEIYQSLATGVVEGAAVGGIFGGWAFKLHEVTDYFVKPYLQHITNLDLMVNKKKWDSMSKQHQAVIEATALSVSSRLHGWVINKEVATTAIIKSKGKKFSYMNEEAKGRLLETAINAYKAIGKSEPKHAGKIADLLVEFLKNKA